MNIPEKVIITGASDGIGREMAKAYARRGAALGLLARRGELLQAVKAECLAAGSPQVEVAAGDVAISAQLRSALQALDSALGGATVFVANAGVTGRSRIEVDNFEEAKRCLDVNVLGAIDGLEWMKARMIQRGRGTLAGVSSVAGVRGLPDSGAYSASKAALTTYLESMRIDLRQTGIKVVTVVPGFIDTALTKKNKGKMPFLMPPDRAGEAFVRGISRGQRVVVAPWQYLWVIQLLKVLPASLYDAVLGAFMGSVRGSRAARK